VESSIAANKDTEKKMKASFTLYQLLRDDEAMTKIAEDLEKVRNVIGILEELKAKGNG
jgi:hypothetical protein